MVRTFGKKDGEEFERILPTHECTDEDWDLFPPADKHSLDGITNIREDPKRGMFCLDKDEDISIYGNERNDNFQSLRIYFLPCNYIHDN